MTAIGEAYRAYLLTQSAITDIVATRIFPSWLPQGSTLPAIVLHDSISGNSYENLEQGDGCQLRRMQVDCYAKDVTAAENLRDQVRLVSSTFGPGLWSDVWVQGCNTDTYTGQTDPPRDGSDNPTHRRIIDIQVTFNEAIASP